MTTPPWPGEPQAHGFSQNPEDDANDFVYTLWKDKMWFCSVYNGEVNVNDIRAKEDVERAIYLNHVIEGVIDSPICQRTEFFFDAKNKICGIETDCKDSEVPVEYLLHPKVNFYKRCLEYLVREEV
jgi:hypothetical protein